MVLFTEMANPREVMWGSDWPHTQSMKARSPEEALQLTPFLEVDDGAWVRSLMTWVHRSRMASDHGRESHEVVRLLKPNLICPYGAGGFVACPPWSPRIGQCPVGIHGVERRGVQRIEHLCKLIFVL